MGRTQAPAGAQKGLPAEARVSGGGREERRPLSTPATPGAPGSGAQERCVSTPCPPPMPHRVRALTHLSQKAPSHTTMEREGGGLGESRLLVLVAAAAAAAAVALPPPQPPMSRAWAAQRATALRVVLPRPRDPENPSNTAGLPTNHEAQMRCAAVSWVHRSSLRPASPAQLSAVSRIDTAAALPGVDSRARLQR